MHEDQMGIQIKEQYESAVTEETMGYNALFYTLGTVDIKPKGRMMKWSLLLILT